MAIFKCKICGGSLDIADGNSVATCEYCGTKQTVPMTKDEVLPIYSIVPITCV